MTRCWDCDLDQLCPVHLLCICFGHIQTMNERALLPMAWRKRCLANPGACHTLPATFRCGHPGLPRH